MKALVLFNDCTEKAEAIINNLEIVNNYIEQDFYDYAIHLYFEYRAYSEPVLTSFQMTKLNGKDKYTYKFYRVNNHSDSHILIKDLNERIELHSINHFEIMPTRSCLIEFIEKHFKLKLAGSNERGLYEYTKE